LDRPNRRKCVKSEASRVFNQEPTIRNLKLSCNLRIRRGTENASAVDKLF
jgi:hypothetical protein